MSLIAQLCHHPVRLDLGGEGLQVLIFHCQWDPGQCQCATEDPDSGGNAVVVLEPHEAGVDCTSHPDSPPLEVEAHVLEWIPQKDPIPAAVAPKLLQREGYLKLAQRADGETRLGGSPFWVQALPDVPVGHCFAAQFNEIHRFWDTCPPRLRIDDGFTVSLYLPVSI